MTRLLAALSLILILTLSFSCRTTDVVEVVEAPRKDYGRALPPGANPLRKVGDHLLYRRLLEQSYDSKDYTLVEAARRSAAWFDNPSAKQHFPIAGVSFERARDGAKLMLEILETSPTQHDLVARIMEKFALYESVGWDGSGEVLFTGYAAVEYEASATRTDEFQYPLYTRPADLVTDPVSGETLGRRTPDGRIVPYPSRREIERRNMLAGTELVWLRSPLDAFLIQTNGSAKLWLAACGFRLAVEEVKTQAASGSAPVGLSSSTQPPQATSHKPQADVMYIGYAGANGRPFTGLGTMMLRRGLVTPDRLGVPAIRDYYRANPRQVEEMMLDNERYVFFTTYGPEVWPSGSLGFRVTERRTLATDKAIFPRGGPMIVATRIPTFDRRTEPFVRLMYDQDTGGAIKAPGRADIYMGEGAAATLLAGRQYQEGRMYYLFLRE